MLDIKSLGNPNKIIFGVIVFLVIFAAIYVYQNRKKANAGAKQQIEGFTQYKIEGADSVALGGYDNVFIGTQALHLDAAIMDVVKSPANKNDLLAGYVRSSELDPIKVDAKFAKDTVNNLITPNIGEFARFKKDVLDGYDGLRTTTLSTTSNLQTQITSNITAMMNLVNSAAPPFSIVAYYGDRAPPGWQICNGEQLMGMDGNGVVYGISNTAVLTPKLSGRVIVGAGKDSGGNDIQSLADNINGRSLTMQPVGAYGGEEQHKLTLAEMPAHAHQLLNAGTSFSTSPGCGTGSVSVMCDRDDRTKNYSLTTSMLYNDQYIQYAGGDSTLTQIRDEINYPNNATKKMNATASHNIMQPYFVLMYIIKQPKYGGSYEQLFSSISSSPMPQLKFTRF